MLIKRYFSIHDVIVDIKYIFNFLELFLCRLKSEKKIKYNLTIVAMIRNEGSYLREWINYHLLVGVDHFVIYDNKSTDDTYGILQPYIKQGIVDYQFLNAENMPQRQAYTNAVVKLRKYTKYMAFIDLDEFLLPVAGDNVFNLIDNKLINNKNAGGLAISWVCFGSSGHQIRPKGGVLESYLMRADFNYEGNKYIKTVSNPRRILSGGVHYPKYYRHYYNYDCSGNIVTGAINNNSEYNFIRINHYASKSIEESIQRSKKGYGKLKHFKHVVHDKNDVYDDSILKFSKQLNDNSFETVDK